MSSSFPLRGAWPSCGLAARHFAHYVVVASALGCAAGSSSTGATGAGGAGGSPVINPATTVGSTTSSTTATASSSRATTSTSATGGAAGVGGEGGQSTSGSGGVGGESVGGAAASGGGGASQGGGGASQGGGGSAPTQHLVVLAVGPTSSEGAAYHDDTDAWTPTVLSATSADAPAITFNGNGTACGALRSLANGGELDFVLWSAGLWSSVTQLALDKTLSGPAMSGGSGLVDLVFQGSEGAGINKFFFDRRDTTWSLADEPVGGAASQSFGPSAAALARRGADDLVAYTGDNGNLFTQLRTNGLWQMAVPHPVSGDTSSLTPAVVALPGAVDYLVAFRLASNGSVQFVTHSAGGWTSPPAPIAGVSTPLSVNAAALPNGDVVLVYQASTTLIASYVRWSAALGRWGVPGVIGTMTAVSAPPVVATGIGTADAEIALVKAADGSLLHLRFTNGLFAPSKQIGLTTGYTSAAIASER